MTFFADLHGTDARLGGKARSLARLSAAGLPTPAGFVVTDQLFRAISPSLSLPEKMDDVALADLDRAQAELMAAPFPAGFSQELAGRLARDALWSVRSSFASERGGRTCASSAVTATYGGEVKQLVANYPSYTPVTSFSGGTNFETKIWVRNRPVV